MSKFKVGDLVRSKESPDAKWRLLEVLKDGWFSGQWEAVDENDGLKGIFSDEDITGHYNATHYTPDSTGKDYLARCEDTFSSEEMIGAYRFTLGKYVDRMGKKTGEPVEKELAKIIDYATRAKAWLERKE